MSGKRQKQRRAGQRVETDRLFEEATQKWLLPAMTKLRQEFARRLRIQRRKFPKMKLPCETCAFRTSADLTDGHSGFVQTTLKFVEAQAKGQTFFCHEAEKVNGEYVIRVNKKLGLPEPCAGWMVLNSTTPEPLDVRKMLGDWQVDFLLQGADVFKERAS